MSEHKSDCATHNEPAMPNGPCDCVEVTEAMYNAGMAYLHGKGTAWCVTDLYKAMDAARSKT